MRHLSIKSYHREVAALQHNYGTCCVIVPLWRLRDISTCLPDVWERGPSVKRTSKPLVDQCRCICSTILSWSALRPVAHSRMLTVGVPPAESGGGSSSSNERSSLLYSKLSAARDYSTFLLGMADHDPPVVVIPSRGEGRPIRPSSTTNNTNTRDTEDSDDSGNESQQQQPRSTGRDTLHSKGEYNPVITILKGLFTNYDLHLDNVGSVARDHLANERTFLAWMRSMLKAFPSFCQRCNTKADQSASAAISQSSSV